MNETKKIYLMIDNVYYRFKNPNECKEKELELLTFNIEEFINKCLEKIYDENNGSTTFSTLKLTIQSKEVEVIPQYITPEEIKEKVYNRLSISNNQESTELNGLSFFLIFLSIFFGMPLTEEELKKIQDEFNEKQNQKGPIPSALTIDECLLKMEEEEAKKQKPKSPNL